MPRRRQASAALQASDVVVIAVVLKRLIAVANVPADLAERYAAKTD